MNIMLDLETLGICPGSVILSIGAVEFDMSGIHREFYTNIDSMSSQDAGCTIDASTVKWWMLQSSTARAALFVAPTQLDIALDSFTEWLPDTLGGIWGNGANFDNVLLVKAYRILGKTAPWSFRKDRCYRTIKSLAPDISLKRVGTHHNSLNDAKTQALHLIEIVKTLGIKL